MKSNCFSFFMCYNILKGDGMKIYFVERNVNKLEKLKLYFKDETNIEYVNNDFIEFIKNNKVDCVVSPANSFGLMDGGFDLAITKWYGDDLQKKVQQYIIDNYYGEQPIGTSFIIETNKEPKYLIHTPTMRVPERILDSRTIYHCMRSCLIEAKKNNIESIVIPMFGGQTGCIDSNTIASMMYEAYKQLQDVPEEINWEYANKIKLKWW